MRLLRDADLLLDTDRSLDLVFWEDVRGENFLGDAHLP